MQKHASRSTSITKTSEIQACLIECMVPKEML